MKPPVIDILTPETFLHCQCYLGAERTTHNPALWQPFFAPIAFNAFPRIRKAAEYNAASSELGAPVEIATTAIDSICLLSISNNKCCAFSDSSSIHASFLWDA